MKLAFSIAKRFLLSAKKQTIIIILGIAVGVSVQVFIGALINGLQVNLIDTAIGSQSQITISHQNEDLYIDDYEQIIEQLNQNNQLTEVAPSITSSGRLSNTEESENIVFKGFNLSQADGIYQFEEKLTENSSLPNEVNQVALGIGLKETFNLSIGDTLNYTDNSNPANPPTTMTIVGFLDFKSVDLNNAWMISTLETSQSILGLNEDQTQNIETQLKDVFLADELSKDIITQLNNDDIRAITWIQRNEELLSGLNGQSVSSLMIQIFVIISVVLGISSVLAITVLQKSKQLGILKAMGIKDKDASKIFLFEGFLLGVFGAIIGIFLGIALLYAFDVFADTGIPITIDLGFIALSAGIAITASTIAALSPAIKSSKLNVIEVIRNG